MQRKRLWIGVLLGVAVLLRSPAVPAVESDPLPAPKGTPHERAISVYNEGVSLMRDKHYTAAQEKFEQALALDETLAEAHNNLAFSLRQQGTHNFARSLHHYNRALELKPDLARAYMYRGVL
jgi:Flp pilus assembly protein TadD